MSDSNKKKEREEEQFEIPTQPKQQELTNEQKLMQQNTMLRSILQSLIPLLDKFQRSQATQLGTISNSIEHILNTLPKQKED